MSASASASALVDDDCVGNGCDEDGCSSLFTVASIASTGLLSSFIMLHDVLEASSDCMLIPIMGG